jgi:hypothetical protein
VNEEKRFGVTQIPLKHTEISVEKQKRLGELPLSGLQGCLNLWFGQDINV